ncbi:segregation and condensation protein A [Caulobacter sp. NIBR2454]|uniref:segregation and condensation protein A n=1 Tax=Caulobacter sp. NIBR2454 TaxID=3015996 RepID=UPI0022B6B2F0|nr:ScpA family protein [Caulobacter sp. NIBR2454]
MNDRSFQPTFAFDAAAEAAEDGVALVIDIDGYEGPLHVLLALARNQKVDLLKLSITKLAEQYLAFVHQARRMRFSLAADYLVMAAWLTYLKSRLLLPKPERPKGEEPPAEEMAALLAFRLAKLDMMRKAVDALNSRPLLKRDIFPRGDPEAIKVVPSTRLEGDLYSLMSAYITQRKREESRRYAPTPPTAYALEEARERLRTLLPEMESWTTLEIVAPPEGALGSEGPTRASFLASTLSASLELVKEGALEARQLDHFQDIYLRRREMPAAEPTLL